MHDYHITLISFLVQVHVCPRFQLSDDSRDICTLSLSLELDLRLLPRHVQVNLLQRPKPNMSKTYSSLRHKNKSKQTSLPMFHIPMNGTINHPMLPNLHPIFLLQLLPPMGHQSLSILSHLLNLFSFFFFFNLQSFYLTQASIISCLAYRSFQTIFFPFSHPLI